MIVDLFAGPGGWDIGARRLGMDPFGVELDPSAVATRDAADLRTLPSDVTRLSPRAFEPCKGLIASPPCTAWSGAGSRGAEEDKPLVYDCARELLGGIDRRARYRDRCKDPGSLLVVEPLRFALALTPEWIALEQVPPVVEFWRFLGRALEARGYRWWAGILEAERYGVPQTRERAFLLARKGRSVGPPAPTHQRFVTGEPQRHDVTLEGEIKPWVSMAEALGWEEGDFVGFPRWNDLDDGNEFRERDLREVTKPAFTLTEKARSWTRHRPATTVACDPRIAQPGHKREKSQPGAVGRMEDAIRVTPEEAATLQGFPPDYPWQGYRTKRFEQIGNAVPPPLAEAVLAAVSTP